jgi:endonuclease/exonuclease/phosphatase (EEP) superfamily protein YafD
MSRHSLGSAVIWLAAAYPVALLVLSLQQVLMPQRNGLLAIGQLLAPHLFLAALLLMPLVLIGRPPRIRRSRVVLRLALAVLVVVGLVRFVPGMVSLPASESSDATQVSVMSWNRQALEGPGTEEVVAILRRATSTVVAIQELRMDDAAGIAADPTLAARYPYRVLQPHGGTFGMGLLSAYPIVEEGWREDPHTVWARLDMGDGRSLTVVNSHPLPGEITTLRQLPLPVGYEVRERDAAIRRLRAELVDPLLVDGEPLLLVGDFNTTVREPAFAELASGLVDVHAAVGLGPGSTWRPDRLEWLPLGLLRIDHMFAGPGIRPQRISTDCTPRGSDHCIVDSVLGWEP